MESGSINELDLQRQYIYKQTIKKPAQIRFHSMKTTFYQKNEWQYIHIQYNTGANREFQVRGGGTLKKIAPSCVQCVQFNWEVIVRFVGIDI
jgi:hypothetical protein